MTALPPRRLSPPNACLLDPAKIRAAVELEQRRPGSVRRMGWLARPDQRFVRFGSKARGWVLLDTVSVGYEIWRQLNNFPPNFPVDGQSPGQAQASGGN